MYVPSNYILTTQELYFSMRDSIYFYNTIRVHPFIDINQIIL